MKQIKIHFKNNEILIVKGDFNLIRELFQENENKPMGDKASFIWIVDVKNEPQVMFNVYDVVYMEVEENDRT